ncbi:hypothetical protein [Chryseobacterium sp.]|uniref:hypothetical protein n=1 Tax=Chryseobacterium sp. TaxID=1871047 RepID=UPI0028974190|nr:hypothetical protein [Chryseobacterium sp.]
MSLNSDKQEAIDKMKTLMADMRTRTDNADQEFAERFFEIMFEWMIKANIKYTTGLVAGANPVTGSFTGNLE